MKRLSQALAGAGLPLADYAVGQRVMTKEGFPGKIDDINEGPGDLTTYWVTLDDNQGGGEYGEGEIQPITDRTSALANVEHTAADDYPELGSILTDRLPPQVNTVLGSKTAGAARTHEDDDDYDDDLNYPILYHTKVPNSRHGEDPVIAEEPHDQESMDEKQNAANHRADSYCSDCYEAVYGYEPNMGDEENTFEPGTCDRCGAQQIVFTMDPIFVTTSEAARRIALTFQPRSDSDLASDRGAEQKDPDEEAGYLDGLADGKAGVTRNFQEPLSPAYRAGYDRGWAFGIQTTRSPSNDSFAERTELDDQQVAGVPDGLVHQGGLLWDLVTGAEPDPKYKGFTSSDWCRYRSDSRCFYSKNLDVEATKLAGYAVWIPEDRGVCHRSKWEDQQACEMAMPGPRVPGGFTRATESWENGGQHNGQPSTTFRQSSLLVEADLDPSLAFHMTASWQDVQAKAKRLRSAGGVRLLAMRDGVMVAHVRGDHGVYETEIVSVPGKHSVASWHCGCKWGAYSWGRSGPWKRFEGRMCSHALAASYEVQSRGAHGREVTLDTKQPEWMDASMPVRRPGDYDRNKGRYSSVDGGLLRSVMEQSDGRPVEAVVALMLSEGCKYAEIKTFAHSVGIEDVPSLVREARKKVDFVGKVRGLIKHLLLDDEGQVVDTVTGDALSPGDVLFPNWDPVKGLNFRPHTGSVKTASPADILAPAQTVEEAAEILIGIARQEEPKCTHDFTDIAHRHGGEMEGLDNRLKQKGSLVRKMTAEIHEHHDNPALCAMGMSDSLRYTMLFGDQNYTAGVKAVLADLENMGYGERVKNYWQRGDAYNGVNAALTTPSGFPVELQFHTSASITAKLKQVHPIYDVWRESKDPFQRAKLGDQMNTFYDSVPRPPGALSIPGLKMQPHVPWKAVDWMRGKIKPEYVQMFGHLVAHGAIPVECQKCGSVYTLGVGHQCAFDKTAPVLGQTARFLLLDSGALLRVPHDHSSIEVWRDGVWVHEPQYAGFHFLGDPRSDEISEQHANALLSGSGLEPSYNYDHTTFAPAHSSLAAAKQATSDEARDWNDISAHEDVLPGETYVDPPYPEDVSLAMASVDTIDDDPDAALPVTYGEDEPDDEWGFHHGSVTVAAEAWDDSRETTYKSAGTEANYNPDEAAAKISRYFTREDLVAIAQEEMDLRGMSAEDLLSEHVAWQEGVLADHLAKEAGFPLCAAGCNVTVSADADLVNTTAGLAHRSCVEDPADAQVDLDVVPDAGDLGRGAALVAQMDEFLAAIAEGRTDVPNPFAHLGDASAPADNEIMAAAASFAAGDGQKVALRSYSPTERKAFIDEGEDEGVLARNFDGLDIKGTHYEALEAHSSTQDGVSGIEEWMSAGDLNAAD